MKRFTLSKFLAALLISTSLVQATSLQDAVNSTLKNNPEVHSIIENNRAYRTYVDEAERGFYPRLDFEIYGETKRGKIKEDGQPKLTATQDGYNAKIQLEQLLYDGGLTPAKLEEAKFMDIVNQYNNKEKVENVLLSTIESYLDLIKYDRRLKLSETNIATHEDYLKTAKSNEEFSGNALDTHEVMSKLHLAKKNYIEEIDNNQIAKNSFKRLTGDEVEGNVCMPNVDRTTLPDGLEKLVNLSIQQNNTILAQVAKISEQRAIINQEEAKFLPTIYAQLSAMRDKDLIDDYTRRDVYSARIVLDYNLYNGGKDEISRQRERIFLIESQKILDSKTDLVVDEITSAYYSYINTKDKIEELQGYVSSNEDILRIYKDQFEGGTRTFVDVLDVETDLYNARVQLIDEEVKLVDLYFSMVSLTSKLQETVLTQSNQVCSNQPIMMKEEKVNELDNLIAVMPVGLVEAIREEFKMEIDTGILEFDTSDMSLRFQSRETAMPIGKDGMLILSDEYKTQLTNFIPRFINTIKPYKDEINLIALNGYASSPYVSAKNKTDIFALNQELSKKRAVKVFEFIKTIDSDTIRNNPEIMGLFKTFGKSSDNVVLKANGMEDSLLSKRVEFTIEGK